MRAPRVSKRLRWMLGLVGITMGVVLMAGVGWATILQEEVSYHGCYGNDGYLRVVQPGADCKKNETPISWNQTGPAGQPGYRAYAKVFDWEGNPSEPQLFTSLHFTSVVRGSNGAYCLLPDGTLPRPYLLVPVASSSAGGPRFIDVGPCESAGVEGIGVQTRDQSGVMVNSTFTVLVP